MTDMQASNYAAFTRIDVYLLYIAVQKIDVLVVAKPASLVIKFHIDKAVIKFKARCQYEMISKAI